MNEPALRALKLMATQIEGILTRLDMAQEEALVLGKSPRLAESNARCLGRSIGYISTEALDCASIIKRALSLNEDDTKFPPGFLEDLEDHVARHGSPVLSSSTSAGCECRCSYGKLPFSTEKVSTGDQEEAARLAAAAIMAIPEQDYFESETVEGELEYIADLLIDAADLWNPRRPDEPSATEAMQEIVRQPVEPKPDTIEDDLKAGVRSLLRLIESAGGVRRLSDAVQLGPTSWAVKTQDAIDWLAEASLDRTGDPCRETFHADFDSTLPAE